MPYIPHARMDRVQELEDVFTLKYFCQVINGLHFDKVIVRDAHSNVALALLDRVIDLTPIGEIKEAIKLFEHYEKETPVLFFPDEGAMKRYSTPAINLPYAFGIKKRDWSTGKILGLQLMNGELVKDKGVLIVDDICSRGGTFYHAANTCNRSENYVGYSTKFGDSAGDFSILHNYTVTEVKEIGLELGLPEKFIEKVPEDGLTGLSDEENLGFSYKTLDNFLLYRITPPYEVYKNIEQRHKRNLP